MLLQGAAIVRFANTFLDRFKVKKDFVLIAIFIRDADTATRYTLFQTDSFQDSRAVCYVICKQACWLSCRRFIIKQRSLGLTRQLAASNSRVTSTIYLLNSTISKHGNRFGLKWFTTGVAQGSKKKRTRTDDGAGAGGTSTADSVELNAHGY